MIILGEYKIVYLKDRQEFKMAGATLMTKHLVTIDEDKDRKKKSGVTALSSQTKAAQKLLQCDKK
ncbi:hypothetical protein LC728_20450 [Bacillus amyloliquefaciens]|uniref:hypothetical protein n=1 Tax=Bacillus amyloliquefaciens TaxID=1390 RepID=UPI001CD33434|nr:hypothetical protein [Bacillus amyloliquefaciens]MCA1216735.1 hypothetical protein [Bacillus amyloliquefaciens]